MGRAGAGLTGPLAPQGDQVVAAPRGGQVGAGDDHRVGAHRVQHVHHLPGTGSGSATPESPVTAQAIAPAPHPVSRNGQARPALTPPRALSQGPARRGGRPQRRRTWEPPLTGPGLSGDSFAEGQFCQVKATVPIPSGLEPEGTHPPAPICTLQVPIFRREVPTWLGPLCFLTRAPHRANAKQQQLPAPVHSGKPLTHSFIHSTNTCFHVPRNLLGLEASCPPGHNAL